MLRAIDKGLANPRIGIVLVPPALLLRLPKENIADKELSALLARLRAAQTPPWPNLSAAIADEYRAIGLAREAGADGAALAAAIMNETERLLAMTD